MKKTIAFFILLSSITCFSQVDVTPIVVNVRDNAKLQWNGVAVKMKFKVIQVSFVNDGLKDFYFQGYLEMYENNGGSYGSRIIDLISSDQSLSGEEKSDLMERYRDREIEYTTRGKYCDASGNILSSTTPGAIPELQYWQSFKMNHASLGMTSASTQGALDGVYKIIIAIVNKLNARKNI